MVFPKMTPKIVLWPLHICPHVHIEPHTHTALHKHTFKNNEVLVSKSHESPAPLHEEVVMLDTF